jgi:hypothetical protein
MLKASTVTILMTLTALGCQGTRPTVAAPLCPATVNTTGSAALAFAVVVGPRGLPFCSVTPVDHPSESLQVVVAAPTFAELDSVAKESEVVVLENVDAGIVSNRYQQRMSVLSTLDGVIIAEFIVGDLDLSQGSEPGFGGGPKPNTLRLANEHLSKHRWIELATSAKTNCESQASLDVDGEMRRLQDDVQLDAEHLRITADRPPLSAPRSEDTGDRKIWVRTAPVHNLQNSLFTQVHFGAVGTSTCSSHVGETCGNVDGIDGAFGSKQFGFVFVHPTVLLGGDCCSHASGTRWRLVRFGGSR